MIKDNLIPEIKSILHSSSKSVESGVNIVIEYLDTNNSNLIDLLNRLIDDLKSDTNAINEKTVAVIKEYRLNHESLKNVLNLLRISEYYSGCIVWIYHLSLITQKYIDRKNTRFSDLQEALLKKFKTNLMILNQYVESNDAVNYCALSDIFSSNYDYIDSNISSLHNEPFSDKGYLPVVVQFVNSIEIIKLLFKNLEIFMMCSLIR